MRLRAGLDALDKGYIDAVFDEGLPTWFEQALSAGMEPLTFEEKLPKEIEAIGWRCAVILASRFPHLKSDFVRINYSGWPLYLRASLHLFPCGLTSATFF